jgi:hypothetical protein
MQCHLGCDLGVEDTLTNLFKNNRRLMEKSIAQNEIETFIELFRKKNVSI